MDELKFVMKCFIFAAILLVLTQLKIGESTVESQLQAGLTSSQTAEFVNKAAEGGVKLIKNSIEYAKTYYFQNQTENKNEVKPMESAEQKVSTEDKPQPKAAVNIDLELEEQPDWSDEK